MIPHEVDYDYVLCKRCNRKLHDELSIDRGFGPICYKKHQSEQAEVGFIENQTTIDNFLEGDQHEKNVVQAI